MKVKPIPLFAETNNIRMNQLKQCIFQQRIKKIESSIPRNLLQKSAENKPQKLMMALFAEKER